MGVGDHFVTVESYKATGKSKQNNDGIEFTCVSNGRKARVVFWLTEAALWRLADFAKACGLTKEEARGYDAFNFSSHRALVNRRVMIRIVKNGKYHEVDDDNGWWAITATNWSNGVPSDIAPKNRDPEPLPTTAPGAPDDKDIPF